MFIFIFTTLLDGRPCRFRRHPDILVSHGEHPGKSREHVECPQELSGGHWGTVHKNWSVKRAGLTIELCIPERVHKGQTETLLMYLMFSQNGAFFIAR